MNQVAMIAAIGLLVDAGKGIAAELQPGQSLSERIADFQPAVADAIALFPQGSELLSELKSIQPSDIPALSSVLVSDIALQPGHASDVVNASLKVFNDIAGGVVPDALSLLHVINGQPAPSASAIAKAQKVAKA